MEKTYSTPLPYRVTQALLMLFATAMLSGCLIENIAADAAQLSGSATVIDGDGLRLDGQIIRIHGIDAPKMSQTCVAADGSVWPCGQATRSRMSELVAGREVRCRQTDRDHYGRAVAVCEIEGIDVGQVLVTEGLAWAYRHYSSDYVIAENSARERSPGIWSAPTRPAWEYRAGDRTAEPVTQIVAASANSSCRIKGNISRSGERIYHVPGSRNYEVTWINTSHGERWFCSVAEATAAGWRAPRSR